jgi:hypothetical protein
MSAKFLYIMQHCASLYYIKLYAIYTLYLSNEYRSIEDTAGMKTTAPFSAFVREVMTM